MRNSWLVECAESNAKPGAISPPPEGCDMRRELKLPDVGEGIAEGEIVAWHVEPGDTVEEDQVLGEVETDKAVVDVPSPFEGTVVELHADPGDVVAVGTVIVTFEIEGDAAQGGEEHEESEMATADSSAAQSTDSGDTGDGQEESPSPSETTKETDQDNVVNDVRVFAPPHVRRLARELNVTLGAVANTVDGPISATDVRRAAGTLDEDRPAQAVEASTQPEGKPKDDPTVSQEEQPKPRGQQTGETVPQPAGSADREKTLAAPATRQLAREEDIDIDTVPTDGERDGVPFVTPEDVRGFANEETVTVSSQQDGSSGAPRQSGERTEKRVTYKGIRKVIGDNMEQAKFTAPHVAHHDSAEIDDLVVTRETFKERVDEDVSITYLPFVIKAVVKALKDHPYMNSTLDKEAGEITLKQYYDIGIATATDRGLVVPVIRDAHEKSILELAREIDNLISRARNGDLAPDEMRGSTFTITNFGAIGGEYATPIINYPEAAILGLGAITERPVVVDGEVVARHTLPLSLSVDHRLIDGAVAAQFTNDVKTYLHTPEMLLL